jgi:hypothetical protein
VPEAVDVSDLVGARLARHERFAVGVSPMATLAGAHEDAPWGICCTAGNCKLTGVTSTGP